MQKKLFPIREILSTVNLGGAWGPYCGVPLEAQGMQLGHQVFYKQVKMEDHTITKEDLQGHHQLSGKVMKISHFDQTNQCLLFIL